jgi:lactate dehydrogenase-like 2-hydroxyacid dehydrogenase
MKAKVSCLRPKHDFDRAAIEIPDSFEIEFHGTPEEETLARVCADADVILTSSTYPPVTSRIISRAKRLKLIQVTGSGYDTVDLAAADQAGVPVARVPGQNAKAVAQLAFVLMSILSRRILEADTETKKGNYEEVREKIRKEGAYELEGRNLGILGTGPVGKEMAKIGGFFDANLFYYDLVRLSGKEEKELKLTYVDRETLFKTSDILTLHIPLTRETRKLISSKELALMKPGAILINTSRGGIVDDEALIEALKANRLKGAALDAFEPEPIPRDHPFLRVDADLQKRLLLTPHVGGATRQAHRRMLQEAIQNILRVMRGEKPKYVVNLREAP